MAAIGEAFGEEGIDQMAYFGHSFSGGLSVLYGHSSASSRWITSSTDWSNVQFNANASIFLYGCNGGTGGRDSIAQAIASNTGTTTYGYTSWTFFTNDPVLGRFERRPTDADVNRVVPRSNRLWLVPTNGKPMTQYTP